MFTWEKEIALNCTYRVLNQAPLTYLSIESLAATNRLTTQDLDKQLLLILIGNTFLVVQEGPDSSRSL